MGRIFRERKNFINPGIFKAYDIRGKYPAEINEDAVLEVARALSGFFKQGPIVVGHDARIGSKELYKAAIAGLRETRDKKQVIGVGLSTTPMFYFLVGKLKARGGIMVTASHNPKEYNGLKVVGRGVQMISGLEIKKIMKI